jgi:hypothetical protein
MFIMHFDYFYRNWKKSRKRKIPKVKLKKKRKVLMMSQQIRRRNQLQQKLRKSQMMIWMNQLKVLHQLQMMKHLALDLIVAEFH